MINDLEQFISACKENPGTEYDLFEDDCTDSLRGVIYGFADPASPEPFRSAMIKLGFLNN